MQMPYALPSAGAIIDDEPITVLLNTELACKRRRNQLKMPEQRCVGR